MCYLFIYKLQKLPLKVKSSIIMDQVIIRRELHMFIWFNVLDLYMWNLKFRDVVDAHE